MGARRPLSFSDALVLLGAEPARLAATSPRCTSAPSSRELAESMERYRTGLDRFPPPDRA
ncbi:hypothetical protein ACIRBZ_39650 [Streptomyces sp. NPDC094038]|uniref:hypothetical protein n=1 Tax=Streptomyces sp. NPDC094038 TaxID=3366055 RepID=UPI00380B3CE6